MRISKDRDIVFDGDYISSQVLKSVIKTHQSQLSLLRKLEDYYKGEQDIKNRTKSNQYCANSKGVFNNARNIVDTAHSYVFGNPVIYETDNEELLDNFTQIGEDAHNNEMGLDMGIFGKAYELLYGDVTEDDTPIISLKNLSPLNTFIVYDCDIKQTPLFGVYYYPVYNLDGEILKYKILVYTDNFIFNYEGKDLDREYTLISEEPHLFKALPILEVDNNRYEEGDFYQVIDILDAYNILMNDRINDKEQLVDALLVVSGISFGDTDAEAGAEIKRLFDEKVLELPEGANANFISNALNETQIEILRKALLDDMHKITKIPNMSDENFANNVSGVAMSYKLLGFEQLGKQKELKFIDLLRRRLRLMNNVLSLKGKGFDVNEISIKMYRTLPVNLTDKLQELQGTDGVLSLRTRLTRYDSELDVDRELELIEEEKSNNAQMMANAYGDYNFKANQQLDQLTNDETKEYNREEEEQPTK